MATFDSPTAYCNFLISPRIPPELVLKTIQHLPFNDGKLIACMRSAHPRLREIFKNYERSITACFMKKELRHAEVDFKCDQLNVDWLAACVRSYDIVDDVMDALCSPHNWHAVARHNTSLANAGLLLMYRITSIESHQKRLIYIKSLQHDPLIAIYLVLHHAKLAARYHGSRTGWLSQNTYGRFMDANQMELRNEMEFCFAEATLDVGPDFISDTLLHHDSSNAETTLLNFYHDHGVHDWDWPCWGSAKGEFEPPRTQGPQREAVGRSLFTTLLERLGECMECSLEEVRSRVEGLIEDRDHSLGYLTLGGKERLLQGLNVV